MNTLDVVIAALLALGLVRGFITGFVRQVAQLLALILAFIAAARLTPLVGAWLTGVFGLSDRVAPIVAFIVVFIAIEVAMFLLARLVERTLQALHLSALNRIAGGLAGAFKAALALSIVLLIAGYLGVPNQAARRDSVLYRPVLSILPASWDYVAEHVPDLQRLSDRFTPDRLTPRDTTR
ncbi:MAG TPA: CvpA family protein [Rhodothermales bacterium]|nr:CvpA family protein [Rhodothermales bacterium]